MAAETAALAEDSIYEGLVIAKHGHAVSLHEFRYFEAGHPIPDQDSVTTAAALVEFVSCAAPDEIVPRLISDGASALLTICHQDVQWRKCKQ